MDYINKFMHGLPWVAKGLHAQGLHPHRRKRREPKKLRRSMRTTVEAPPSTRRVPRAVTAAMWVSRGSTAKGPRGSTGTAERQSRCAHLGQRRNGVCAMRTPGRSPLTKLLTFRHPVAARLSSYWPPEKRWLFARGTHREETRRSVAAVVVVSKSAFPRLRPAIVGYRFRFSLSPSVTKAVSDTLVPSLSFSLSLSSGDLSGARTQIRRLTRDCEGACHCVPICNPSEISSTLKRHGSIPANDRYVIRSRLSSSLLMMATKSSIAEW